MIFWSITSCLHFNFFYINIFVWSDEVPRWFFDCWMAHYEAFILMSVFSVPSMNLKKWNLCFMSLNMMVRESQFSLSVIACLYFICKALFWLVCFLSKSVFMSLNMKQHNKLVRVTCAIIWSQTTNTIFQKVKSVSGRMNEHLVPQL